METESTTREKQQQPAVIIVGVDESEQSQNALEWTLDRFFLPLPPNNINYYPFKLIVLHARPSTASVVGGFAGPAPVVYPLVDADLKRVAKDVLDTARQICHSRSVDSGTFVQMVGDAREVLVEAAEKYQASMLVVGSHGHGFLKRAFLGSVSDHCAHHACCCVLIVKPPPPLPPSRDKHRDTTGEGGGQAPDSSSGGDSSI